MLAAPDVVGPGEARELLNMSRPTFSRHKTREEFPPAQRLECGDVYERRAILAYSWQRASGIPYLRALELHRDGMNAHTIADALTHEFTPQRAYSAARVRAWLRKLGEPQR